MTDNLASADQAEPIVIAAPGAIEARQVTVDGQLLQIAVRHGGDVTFHLMNAEPGPISYRVKLPGKAVKATGYVTTPDADMVEASPKALTLKTDASGIAVTGTVPGYALLSVVLPGAAAKKKSP